MSSEQREFIAESERWDTEEKWRDWCAQWFRSKVDKLSKEALIRLDGLDDYELEDNLYRAIISAASDPYPEYYEAYDNAYVHIPKKGDKNVDGRAFERDENEWWIGFGDGTIYLPTGLAVSPDVDFDSSSEESIFYRLDELQRERERQSKACGHLDFVSDFDETFPDKCWMDFEGLVAHARECIESAVDVQSQYEEERRKHEGKEREIKEWEEDNH